MDTILELLNKIRDLPSRIWRLQELPERLGVAKDCLDTFRGDDPHVKASLTAFDPDDLFTCIATTVRYAIDEAGLEYDSSADLWRSRLEEFRKAAEDLISQARTRLDEVSQRDLTDIAKRNVAELERATQVAEKAISFLDDLGPYLETIKNLRDDILELPD